MTVVAFGSHNLDIFEVNDIMSSKGWHLNALQRPNRWFFNTKGYDRKITLVITCCSVLYIVYSNI